MTTKLIILIILGVVVLGGIAWCIVRAWRYRRDHPKEVYWPYNDMQGDKEKEEKKTII